MAAWFLLSDRPKHIKLGLCIYVAATAFALLIGIGLTQAFLVGLMAVIVAAITKEFTDYLHGSKFDVLDALATVAIPLALTVAALVLIFLL